MTNKERLCTIYNRLREENNWSSTQAIEHISILLDRAPQTIRNMLANQHVPDHTIRLLEVLVN